MVFFSETGVLATQGHDPRLVVLARPCVGDSSHFEPVERHCRIHSRYPRLVDRPRMSDVTVVSGEPNITGWVGSGAHGRGSGFAASCSRLAVGWSGLGVRGSGLGAWARVWPFGVRGLGSSGAQARPSLSPSSEQPNSPAASRQPQTEPYILGFWRALREPLGRGAQAVPLGGRPTPAA